MQTRSVAPHRSSCVVSQHTGVCGWQAAITAQLDEALLTDEELVKYDENYASMEDPVHPSLASPGEESAPKKVKVADH